MIPLNIPFKFPTMSSREKPIRSNTLTKFPEIQLESVVLWPNLFCQLTKMTSKPVNQIPESDAYLDIGVSTSKNDVYRASRCLPDSIAPQAFCRILPDIFNNDKDYCVLSHADGAGTKSLMAVLHYRIHHDPTVFHGIAQDAVVMNLDDMICAGATTGFSLVTIINRNRSLIGEDILGALIEGAQLFAENLSSYGVDLTYCGGETADVADAVRTVLLDSVLTTRFRRSKIVHNRIQPRQLIVGLPSGGKPTTYEAQFNSGIGSNGMTLARHSLLKIEAPEKDLYDARSVSAPYSGAFAPNDKLPNSPLTALESLLSPTRTFAPIIKDFLHSNFDDVSGIIHCTGGGQTKCLKFGDRIHYNVDFSKKIPELFHLIQRTGNVSWLEMATVFNLGYRMLLICEESSFEALKQCCNKYEIEPEVLGSTERSTAGKNMLTIRLPDGYHQLEG